MLDCSHFLDDYSSFRDGLLPEESEREFEAHLFECASCARYDEVVREGSRLLCRLPAVEPSDDFLPRLEHRILQVEAERSLTARATGTSGMLVMAMSSLLAIAAWGPLARSEPAVIELPPVAARAPEPRVSVPLLYQSGPLLSTAAEPASARAPLSEEAVQSVFFRYSPMGAQVYLTVSATSDR